MGTTLSWGSDVKDVTSYTFGTVKSRVRSCGNEIYFTSDVSTESIDALMTELMAVVSKADGVKTTALLPDSDDSPRRVTLYIDSPGGVVKDCFKFIDFVNLLKGSGRLHLTTVIIGMAASAATLMACVGDERYISSMAVAMVHELFGGSIGTYTKITSGMKRLADTHSAIVSLYMRYNKIIKREELLAMLLRETWFDAREYLAAGFVDKVLGGDDHDETSTTPSSGVTHLHTQNDSVVSALVAALKQL